MATQHSRTRYQHTQKDDAMEIMCFSIPGEAVPQGRPRAYRAGNAIRMYQPPKSTEYQNLVKMAASQEMNGRKPFAGQLKVKITVNMAIPKSMPQWLRNDLQNNDKARPTKKPDLDNLAKSILDGMTGVVYKDDAQVTTLLVRKKYDDIDIVHVSVEFNQTLQRALEEEEEQRIHEKRHYL